MNGFDTQVNVKLGVWAPCFSISTIVFKRDNFKFPFLRVLANVRFYNVFQLFCENNGGYMVEITNLAEDTFVRDFVRNRAFTGIY